MSELPLDAIDDNPFNCRLQFSAVAIKSLADSLRKKNLLVPIKVRETGGRYQLIFGHRRVRAARSLGWKTIRGEIVSATDEQMLEMSLAENVVRADLSAYEKAKSMYELSKTFGKNYDEIGSTLGFSKSHVANYIRMLDLFQPKTLEENPDLIPALHQITEHHARVLLRIPDTNARISALRLVLRESLSVRELEQVLRRLKGWFDPNSGTEPESVVYIDDYVRLSGMHEPTDVDLIREIIQRSFTLPRKGTFEEFAKLHDFGSAFSIYSFSPPFNRLIGSEAVEKERYWFFSVAPTLKSEIKSLTVQLFDKVALVTVDMEYSHKDKADTPPVPVRGTVMLFKRRKKWRIVHEHSSISRELGKPKSKEWFARANFKESALSAPN